MRTNEPIWQIRFLLVVTAAYSGLAGRCNHFQDPNSLDTSNSDSSGQVIVSIAPGIYPRLDINQLISDPDLSAQLDLFVQAYSRVQERPATSPVSYYQIASIHGQPYVAWDGVKSLALKVDNATQPINGTRPGSLNTFAGYCWHASVLFPTWHRAYTLLIEQEIRSEAGKIAKEYGGRDRKKYEDAAKRLRFPFWDWTSEDAAANGIPEFVLRKEVTVNTPRGRKHVRNPLESFILPVDVAEGSVGSSRNQDSSNGQTAGGAQRSGNAPSMQGNPTLRHPDINLDPQYDRLQSDLRSEV